MKKIISLVLALLLLASLSALAASGEPGGASGGASGESSIDIDTTPILCTRDYTAPAALDMKLDGLYTGEDAGESLGNKTVKAGEVWKPTANCRVDTLELTDGAAVEADVPVIVFFKDSKSVKNGEVRGNVQFVCDYDEIVAIVHTNDTHGFLSSEPYVRGLKTQLEQSGLYSLVLAVNAGDVYSGGYAAAHVYEGEYIPYVMSKTYDYMTWGNNDAGITGQGIASYLLAMLGDAEGLTTLVSDLGAVEDVDIASYAASYEPAVGTEELLALYPDTLSQNPDGSINYNKLGLAERILRAGDNVLEDAALIETATGAKLGLIGMSSKGGSMEDAYFTCLSTSPAAQLLTDTLLDEGASAVVLMTHTGWMGADSNETSSNDVNSAQLAKTVTGLDAIIDSHTHSVINGGEGWLFAGYGNAPLVNQAGCKDEGIGVLYLYLKNGAVIAKDGVNLVPDENGTFTAILPDAEVQAAVDRVHQRLADDGYTTVWASSEHFLNAERLSVNDPGGAVRANETNLGDLVADSILWTAQQRRDEDIRIALYPGYWIRASLPAGDITLVDAMSVFGNKLKIYYTEYTAAELVSMMQTAVSGIGKETNQYYQVAGLTCTYDPATLTLSTLTVGDELIYDHGEYKVGNDWTVGCAAEVGGPTLDNVPDGDPSIIVPSNTEMARCFCEFLANAEYTIYPNEAPAGGRVTPEK